MARAVAFDRQTRDTLARQLVRRLRDEFDVEIAPMDGDRLLDILSDTAGAYFYNQGLYDAQAVLKDQCERISEAIAGLERAAPR